MKGKVSSSTFGTGRIGEHDIAGFFVVVACPGHDLFEMLVRKIIPYRNTGKGLIGIGDVCPGQNSHRQFHIIYENTASIGGPVVGQMNSGLRIHSVQLLNKIRRAASAQKTDLIGVYRLVRSIDLPPHI